MAIFEKLFWITFSLSISMSLTLSDISLDIKNFCVDGGMTFYCSISSNTSEIINLESNEDHSNVTWLHFQSSSFAKFPLDIFNVFPNVTNLVARDCDLQVISKTSLTDEFVPSLRSLDLFYNSIKRIPNETFYYLRNLEDLNLERNEISAIETDAFKYLINLKSLVLRENSIQEIGIDFFRHVPNLKRINLSYNKIKSIDENVFVKSFNSGLIFLNLDGNEFQELHVSNVVQLSLKDGKVQKCFIEGNVRYFNAEGNQICTFSIINGSAIQEINLRNNSLTDLDVLKKFPDLKKLDLSGNPIESLIPYTFSNNTKLQELSLSSIVLHQLLPLSFAGLSQLTALDLSDNLMKDFDIQVLSDLDKIKELHLQNNDFREFNYRQIKSHAPTLNRIELSGNPFAEDYYSVMEEFFDTNCIYTSNSTNVVFGYYNMWKIC